MLFICQPDCKKAQDGLFNRIADSFVSLFFSVSPDFKDMFFQVKLSAFNNILFVKARILF